MINLTKSKQLAELEAELKKLNDSYTQLVRAKVQSAVNSFGKEFKDFFSENGLAVSEITELNSSPQTKKFITSTGRVKIEFICNHRDSSLEYFELKWNDEAFKNYRKVIYSSTPQRLHGFDIERSSDTDQNIENTKTNIETLKQLIKDADKIKFEFCLASEDNLRERKPIKGLTEILKSEFS